MLRECNVLEGVEVVDDEGEGKVSRGTREVLYSWRFGGETVIHCPPLSIVLVEKQ